MKFFIVTLFAHLAQALDSENRLVRVWDSLDIYRISDQEKQGSWNMTTFPYIQGVSLFRLIAVVRKQHHLQWLPVLHPQHNIFQLDLQLNAA